jgi:cytochrome c-type biogenesis protein CcmH
MKRLTAAVLLLLAALSIPPALAADPSEMLKDPVQEKRAHDLGKELRCLVCQNESIEDSNADLARDLRVIVREQIAQGASNDQVMKFVVDRYGDYVLLKPPFKITTLALWVGPFVLLLGALAAALAFFRRRKDAPAPLSAPLSEAEKRRLEALLKDSP